MDRATAWLAVEAIKERNLHYGRDMAEIQLNKYRKESLPERIAHLDTLLSLSRKYQVFYDAVKAIAHYHADNDDTPEAIPPALGKWAIDVLTKWTTRPESRLISKRDTAILHSMIVLVEFEGWSALQAQILISQVFGTEKADGSGDFIDPTYQAVEKIWTKARENRDNRDKPEHTEYMGFFISHAGEANKQAYEAWKAEGFPIYIMSA